MRTSRYLFGIALTAGVLGAGMLQTQAAEPAQARAFASCGDKQARCAAVKRVRAEGHVLSVQTSKASLDLSVCNRLQTKLERDTCLNHVEATV